MDGHFVPNLTFGTKMTADIHAKTNLFLDAHLMVTNPETYVESMAASGAGAFTFHYEATVHHHRLVEAIHALGMLAGVSIVPSTPVSQLEMLLPIVDLVLVMSVNPGFGGQNFIPAAEEKVRQLALLRSRHGYAYKISIDGGINKQTLPRVKKAGIDVAVIGSAFFSSVNKTIFIEEIRNAALA